MSLRRWLVAPLLVIATAVAATGCDRTAPNSAGRSGDIGGSGGAAASADSRDFGIASDPWKVDQWAAAVGARPTMVMGFEHWVRSRTLDDHFAKAHQIGLRSFVVTWEPWEPVDAARGKAAQYAEQPRYSNAAIAAGKHDDYVRAFARSVARSGLTVYMRYAHEMNGDWYPWSRDAEAYVQAWRRVVDIFREERATNAKWVFSLNPSLHEDVAVWEPNARRYWPGASYVDYLGSTMINFGGTKEKSVAQYAERIERMHRMFGKDVIITELNAAAEGRLKWFTDLRTWLVVDAPWVKGVVLSQYASRAQAQLRSKVGDLSWSVTTDPETRPVVRALIEDIT